MERLILRHLSGLQAHQVAEISLDGFVEVVLGRDPASGIRFDPDKDSVVGRRHACISRDAVAPHRFILRDLGSRNGTFVNALRLADEMPLRDGDVIQLGAGGPRLRFEIDASTSDAR